VLEGLGGLGQERLGAGPPTSTPLDDPCDQRCPCALERERQVVVQHQRALGRVPSLLELAARRRDQSAAPPSRRERPAVAGSLAVRDEGLADRACALAVTHSERRLGRVCMNAKDAGLAQAGGIDTPQRIAETGVSGAVVGERQLEEPETRMRVERSRLSRGDFLLGEHAGSERPYLVRLAQMRQHEGSSSEEVGRARAELLGEGGGGIHSRASGEQPTRPEIGQAEVDEERNLQELVRRLDRRRELAFQPRPGFVELVDVAEPNAEAVRDTLGQPALARQHRLVRERALDVAAVDPIAEPEAVSHPITQGARDGSRGGAGPELVEQERGFLVAARRTSKVVGVRVAQMRQNTCPRLDRNVLAEHPLPTLDGGGRTVQE
jgi:hypothetical protein